MEKTSASRQKNLEDGVLWAIIYGREDWLTSVVIAEDFTIQAARSIYEIIEHRQNDGLAIDDAIVADLPDKELEYLMSATNTVPIFAFKGDELQRNMNELIRRSDLRFTVRKVREIEDRLKNGSIQTVDEAVAELQLVQDSVATRHNVIRETLIGESVKEGLKQVERNRRLGRLRMGFPMIDQYIGGGIPQGEYIIIGARTNVGKSILSLYPAIEATKDGKWALLASNEMSSEQMSMRMLSNISGVRMSVIEGEAKPIKNDVVDELAKLADGMRYMQNLPIAMLPQCYYVSQIAEALERRKRAGTPVSIVLLDHIQRIRSDNPKNTKMYDVLTETSRRLQELSKRYNCTIIAMAQINRAGTMAEKVLVSHLEGSGVLEQDPDKVFLMYCDKTDPEVRLLELAKNRSGQVSSRPFRLKLTGNKMRFDEEEVPNYDQD